MYLRGLRRHPEVLLRLTTYRALAWKFLGSGDARLDDEEILTLMQRDQLKEPFTDMCLEALLKAVGEKFGYARSYNLLRAYNLVPLPAVTAEHDEEILELKPTKDSGQKTVSICFNWRSIFWVWLLAYKVN